MMRKISICSVKEEVSKWYWNEQKQRNKEDASRNDAESLRSIIKIQYCYQISQIVTTCIVLLSFLFISRPDMLAFINISFSVGMSLHADR